MKDKSKKAGGARKVGRQARKNCKVQYRARNVRLQNKCKRVLQSNGEFALRYYRKTGQTAPPPVPQSKPAFGQVLFTVTVPKDRQRHYD